MKSRPKIVFLRSTIPYTASNYYFNGFTQMDIDLVEVPFDPHGSQDGLKIPEGDFLVLVDCGLPVDFPALNDYRTPKGYVSIDSCHKLDIHKAYCAKNNFDRIWVAQKHVAGEFGPNAMWLPLAADPQVHAFRPEMAAGTGFVRGLLRRDHYDIGMCGAPYKHRRRFEKLFRQAGLSTNFYYRKRFAAQATAEIARCTIGFNIGAGFAGTKGKDLNMRVFETMANGQAMLLTNTYDGLGYEEIFTDGVHYATFRTEDEAVEKALYYSRRPAEAIKIAREGQNLILSGHTYLHRCREMLSSVGFGEDL